MVSKDKFIEEINNSYHFEGDAIILGGAMLDSACIPNTLIKIPLKTMNRHGLIAGATGSGKTKTLQILAEQLSSFGVPSLLMDIKGDLSGIAQPGTVNPKILERHQKIGLSYTTLGSPVEFLTLSNEKGARLRATVLEFGPVLFSKILELNDVQSGVVSIIFKYCDDNNLPIIDLKDFKKVLNYFTNEGKEEIEQVYGRVSTMTAGSILRKVVELEQQGAEIFFGELSFEVEDLLKVDENGKGIIHILRLSDIQDRPKMFSTFMLQLLAEIYATFPEEGDLEQPKLAVFIDEAHLVFNEASKALLNQMEAIIKLIRSKGVGVYFCTQNPADIPDAVLSQLGMKVQHALRAFTAKDRKDIKLVAQNYPLTDYYDIENLLTNLGIGEAFITALNDKGIPTPLVHTYLRAPMSRMDILTPSEIDQLVDNSRLVLKYNQIIDNESAYEILTKKIEQGGSTASTSSPTSKKEGGMVKEILTSAPVREMGRTIVRELTRGLLGALGIGRKRNLF
jgi:uncharacterized protein